MDPVSIAMLAGNLAKTGFGIYQGVKANKMAQGLERPDYQIPDEVYQNLDQAEIMMLEGLPAEQKRSYLDNIERTTQSALENIDKRKGGSGFTQAIQLEQDAQKNLLAQDVAQKQANIAEAMRQRQNVAGYKDKKQEDQMRAYEDQAAAIEALTGASIENIFGGVQQGISQYADYKLYKDLLGVKPDITTQDKTVVDQGYESAINKAYKQKPQINLGTYTPGTSYLEKGIDPSLLAKTVYTPSGSVKEGGVYNFLTGKFE